MPRRSKKLSERTHPKTIHVNGTELHYIEQGEGEPVVFVHGGLGDFRTWTFQMKPFAEHYCTISYSRRAHYPNAWDEEYTNSSLALHVDDLAALIESVGLGSTRLVGNSYGAYICLHLALRRPELVRALALAEPPVHPLLRRLPEGEALYQEFIANAWHPAGQAFGSGDLEQGVKLFLEGAVGEGTFDEMQPRTRAGIMKNAPEMQVATKTEANEHMPDFTCEDAATIKAPTLLLRGELSPRMYYLINDELARCMPNAEQALVPNAAHVLHSQNPEAHNRLVLEFFARH